MDDRPWFLIVKTPSGADPKLDAWTAAILDSRGALLTASRADQVEVLEPGTAHTALLVARFAFESDLVACWNAHSNLVADDVQVLACVGLPYEGWPGHDVPTIATVMVPAAEAPRAYMLVEGTGTDEERMDRYRDIILPILRDRGAYYSLFELGGNVRVLAGSWSQGILAISRWPSADLAKDFWFCERYQKTAVPIRTGAGTFDVQLTDGLLG
jgi:uncharacterized protein (DUF1330 family)